MNIKAKLKFLYRKPFQKASQKVYKIWANKVGGMELIQNIIDFDDQSKTQKKTSNRFF